MPKHFEYMDTALPLPAENLVANPSVLSGMLELFRKGGGALHLGNIWVKNWGLEPR